MAAVDAARNIYWESGWKGGPEFLWFGLERPSYFSCLQGTGAMFYEKTALEYDRRGRVLAQLNSSGFEKSSADSFCLARQDPEANGPAGREQLRRVCEALPDLDFIALLTEVPGTRPITWDAPAPQYVVVESSSHGGGALEPSRRHYLYSCGEFRSNSSISAGG